MKIKPLQIIAHVILILGVLLMVLPIWISFASSTHENVSILTEGMRFTLGDQFSRNYNEVLNEKGGWSEEVTAAKMFMNSFIMALGIATLKVAISAMSADIAEIATLRVAIPNAIIKLFINIFAAVTSSDQPPFSFKTSL